MTLTVAEVRSLLNGAYNSTPQEAPHGRFWDRPLEEWANAPMVQRDDPRNSLLVRALQGDPPFDGTVLQQMPKDGSKLSQDAINAIVEWIAAGAR